MATKMLYTKNRLFEKHGHECEIIFYVDEFPMFIPTKDWKTRIFRKFIRLRMASEINRRGNYYLRSQGAIAEEHSRHLKYLYMIHPFSDFRTLWEIFMMLIFLLQFISIPLLIVYETINAMQENPIILTKLAVLLDSMCLCDLAMNFITGYYDLNKKEVVLDPKKVARHYLKTFFIFDVVSSIPKVFEHKRLNKVLLYLSTIKCLRYFTFRTYCVHFAETFDWGFLPLTIFSLSISIILYFHIICCLLLIVYGSLFFVDTQCIYDFSEGIKNVVTTGYMSTLYIATLVCCAAGYGTVVGFNSIKWLLIVLWSLSKLLYIYFLAIAVSCVSSMSSSSHKYFEVVQQLKEYMRYKQLPAFMQKRLLDYYEFRFQKCYFRENEIISTVSEALQQEITVHQCRKLVERVEFFKNMPTTILVRIAACLKTEVFLVNDVIIRANTHGDSMYFISTGNVAIYTKSGKEICHLEDGDYFGEIALVMQSRRRIASVIAIEICEVFRLDRRDFVRAIYPYPDLLNKVLAIANDRLEKTSIVDEHCLIAAFYNEN